MGLVDQNKFRKAELERKKNELNQAQYRKVLGRDVSDDTIDITVKESRSASEVVGTSIRRVFILIIDILLVLLAMVGAASLIFPAPRAELIKIFGETVRFFTGG